VKKLTTPNPKAFLPEQIKPEYRPQANQDTYQANVIALKSGNPGIEGIELFLDVQEINKPGSANANPEHRILRMYAGLSKTGLKGMYAGLSKAGLKEVPKTVGENYDLIDGGAITLATLVEHLDRRFVREEELCKELDIELVMDPAFFYGQAWKIKEEGT